MRVPLINKPKILFADEPTANPDSVYSRQILELWQTILMVTHELEDVDIVDRVIWLADGEVVAREGRMMIRIGIPYSFPRGTTPLLYSSYAIDILKSFTQASG